MYIAALPVQNRPHPPINQSISVLLPLHTYLVLVELSVNGCIIGLFTILQDGDTVPAVDMTIDVLTCLNKDRDSDNIQTN